MSAPTAFEAAVIRYVRGSVTPESSAQLLAFQGSAAAWQTAVQMLQSAHQEVAMFVANTLLQKSINNLPQIPTPEAKMATLTSMLQVLKQMTVAGQWTRPAGTPRGLLTRAAAHLVLAIPDLPLTFMQSQLGAALGLGLTFEIMGALAIITHESGMQMRVTQGAALRQMREVGKPVMRALLQAMRSAAAAPVGGDNEAAASLQAGFKCMEDMGKLHVGIETLHAEGVLVPMLQFMHTGTAQFQWAGAAITAIAVSGIDEEYADATLAAVLPLVLALQGPCAAAAAVPDDANAIAVCELLAEFLSALMGNCLAPALARVEPAAVQGIIQIAITLMTHKSMSVSERLFPFWSKLTDYDTTPSWNQAVFVPLTQVAVLTGAHPTGFQGWDTCTIDEEEFERFRANVVRVLRDCANKAGTAALVTMAEVLHRGTNASKWETTEAVLFAAGSISTDLLYAPGSKPGLDKVLPALFGFVLRTDSVVAKHPLVVQSTLRLAAAYASWLNDTPAAVFGVLKYVLGVAATPDDGTSGGGGGGSVPASSAVGDAAGGAFAARGGSVEAMTTGAGQAFRDICTACDTYIATSSAVDELIAGAARGFDGAGGPKLVEGLVRVVQQCPTATIPSRIATIAKIIVGRMDECASSAAAASAAAVAGGGALAAARAAAKKIAKRAGIAVACIAGMIEQLEDCTLAGVGPAVVPVVKLAWPSLAKLAAQFRGEGHVQLMVAVALGTAFESGGAAMLPMLPQFLDFIVGSYNADRAQPCWFELLGRMCDHCHAGAGMPMLVRAGESLTAGMIAELKGDLLSLPELVREYLVFGGGLMHAAEAIDRLGVDGKMNGSGPQSAVSNLVYSPMMAVMLQAATRAVCCDSYNLAMTAASFLEGALTTGATAVMPNGAAVGSVNAVVAWLGNGEEVLVQLVHAMVMVCPDSIVDLVAELLKSLMALMGVPRFFQMLGALVASPRFAPQHVPSEARLAFVAKLQAKHDRGYQFVYACTDFSTLCRTSAK